jgi:hypothetical protein
MNRKKIMTYATAEVKKKRNGGGGGGGGPGTDQLSDLS